MASIHSLVGNRIIILFLLVFAFGNFTGVSAYSAGPTLDVMGVVPGSPSQTDKEKRAALFSEVAGRVANESYFLSGNQEKREKFIDCFIEHMMAKDDDPLHTDEITKVLNTCNPEDKYDLYFTPQAWAEFWDAMDGSLEGIGVNVRWDEDKTGLVIHSILPGSSLQGGPLRKEDVIKAVRQDGADQFEPIAGKEIDKAIAMIRGPKGSKVHLDVWRDGQRLGVFTVKRKTIDTRIVEVEIYDNKKIGYIKFYGFDAGIFTEKMLPFLFAFKHLGVKNVIFDVRGNPGGRLDETLTMTKAFLPAGKLFFNFCSGDSDELCVSQFTSQDGPFAHMRVVVLVDKESASASELFSGVLQYQKRAFIIGEKTRGKGCAQNTYDLRMSQGAGLKFTTAFFYFDAGRTATPENRGITPDIQINNQEGSSVDVQLNTALDYFRSNGY